MRSVNKVTLIGNLTRDPESKETAKGRKIVTFTIATNREWVTSEGDKKTLAEFHSIAAWGKLADICAEHLKKGKLVYVEGYLKTRYWETPEGQKASRTEIVAYDMIMLNKKGDHSESDTSFVPDDSTEGIFDDINLDEESGDDVKEEENKEE